MKVIARGLGNFETYPLETVEIIDDYVKILIEFSNYDELFYKLIYYGPSRRELEFLDESPYAEIREKERSKRTKDFVVYRLKGYKYDEENIERLIEQLEKKFEEPPTLVIYPPPYIYREPKRLEKVLEEYDSLAYYCPLARPRYLEGRCLTVYVDYLGIEIIGKLLEKNVLPIPVHERLPERIKYVYGSLLREVSPFIYIDLERVSDIYSKGIVDLNEYRRVISLRKDFVLLRHSEAVGYEKRPDRSLRGF